MSKWSVWVSKNPQTSYNEQTNSQLYILLMIECLFLSLLFLAHFFHIYYYVFGCCKTANWTMTLKLKHVSFFNYARNRREFKIIFDTPFMMMLWNSTFDTGSINMMRDETSDSSKYSRFIVALQWHWFLLPSIHVWIKQQLTSRLKWSYTAPCVRCYKRFRVIQISIFRKSIRSMT